MKIKVKYQPSFNLFKDVDERDNRSTVEVLLRQADIKGLGIERAISIYAHRIGRNEEEVLLVKNKMRSLVVSRLHFLSGVEQDIKLFDSLEPHWANWKLRRSKQYDPYVLP